MFLPRKDKKFIMLVGTVAIVITLEVLSLNWLQIPFPYGLMFFWSIVLYIGREVIKWWIKALLKFDLSSIQLLMLIAVIGAFYLEQYPEAAVIIVLYVLGETLEDIGMAQSKSALQELVNKTPKVAKIAPSGEERPIESIHIGMIIQIKPWDIIPLDGIITHGTTAVDEATITWEPLPKEKTLDDMVFAGTLNTTGYIEIRVNKTANDSTLAKIISLTFEAQANKSNTQKFIQKFAKYYTPLVVVIALLLVLMPVFLWYAFQYWLEQAITLLVIACPCALVISTPVATYAALGNASKHGVLVKWGKYLEAMSRLEAIGIDKTRTITYGKPVVSDIITFGDITQEELLGCIWGAERKSEHPLASAIVNKALEYGIETHQIGQFKSVAGKWFTATCTVCQHWEIIVGKADFIKELSTLHTEAEQKLHEREQQWKTVIVVSYGNECVWLIAIYDAIKEDSQHAIDELKQMGVHITMITGDGKASAQYTASIVWITDVQANCLPEDKASAIKQLKEQYSVVAMIWDWVNDAPALAIADIGVAMGAAGSDTAIETANIALMTDKLPLIPYIIKLGKATIRQIKINTALAIGIKILFIWFAILWYGNIVFAIAADVGVTVVVIVLSLRLLHFGGKVTISPLQSHTKTDNCSCCE